VPSTIGSTYILGDLFPLDIVFLGIYKVGDFSIYHLADMRTNQLRRIGTYEVSSKSSWTVGDK
jgi:hypothetical protein